MCLFKKITISEGNSFYSKHRTESFNESELVTIQKFLLDNNYPLIAKLSCTNFGGIYYINIKHNKFCGKGIDVVKYDDCWYIILTSVGTWLCDDMLGVEQCINNLGY